jgi:heme-degrading monooxygenase HmoA
MVDNQPYFDISLQAYDERADEAFFEAMRGIVTRVSETTPGVLETYFAPNVSPYGSHFTHVRLTKFDSREAHEAFQVSAIHDEAVKLVVPRMGYAVGALDFSRITESNSATTQPAPGERPYYHFILFRAKRTFEDNFMAKLRKLQARIVSEVPGLIEFHFERNVSPLGAGWDFVHMSKFTNKATQDAYQVHDAHNAMVDFLMPEVSDAVAGDIDTTRLV